MRISIEYVKVYAVHEVHQHLIFSFQIGSHSIVILHLFGRSLSSKQVNYSYKKFLHPPELWGGTWNATNPVTRGTVNCHYPWCSGAGFSAQFLQNNVSELGTEAVATSRWDVFMTLIWLSGSSDSSPLHAAAAEWIW